MLHNSVKWFAISSAVILNIAAATAQNSSAKPLYSPGMSPVDIGVMKSLDQSKECIPAGSIYADPTRSASERALDLLRFLTFDEKLDMTGGWNRFLFPGVERLGIRPVSLADASQGVRMQTTIVKERSTSFPCMLALASTWNTDLADRFGSAVGEECRALGVDMLLGPGLNIERLSTGGRNFEYMGEDPLLAATMTSSYIGGLQREGIISIPKHFVGNDQEFCRHITSTNIDERTLREIYLVPWEAAYTKAGCLGLMTGNNLVNGVPCTMNIDLLKGIVRDEFGFQGIAMTDWQNTCYYPDMQNLVLTSGESLMMPDNNAFRRYIEEQIVDPIRKNEIEVMLDRMVYYNLYSLFTQGVYDREFSLPENFETFDRHCDFARTCAMESIVLLKNKDSILPIKKGKRILLMGTPEIHSGTGSGFVEGYSHITYEEGLRKIYGNNLTCIENPDDKTIRNADIVLFRLNKDCGEGHDIPFEEPKEQLERLRKVARLNRNVVVIVSAGNAMPTDWVKNVKGVVWCYYLGQMRGAALADVVSGAVAPSGKLPFTIERSFADSPAPQYNYIGGKPYWRGNNQYKEYWLLNNTEKQVPDFSDHVKPGEILDMPYDEGVFVGYRWYDKNNTDVAFPFGFGLSYTRFEYESIECDNKFSDDGSIRIMVSVRNTGKCAAKEIVQLYVGDPQCSVERPEKELKAFCKVEIPAGESRVVEMVLSSRSFAFWGEEGWTVEHGQYIVSVGGSSDNLPLQTTINL